MPAAAPALTIRGLQCRAEQAPDGTWTIRDVPLFGEMVYRGAKTPIQVNKEWLENAVRMAQEGYQRSEYVCPLHVNHHDFGDPVKPAGKFLPTRVARAKTRDGEVWAAFGDLIGVFPEVYAEIRQGRLPYLSCEAHMEKGLLESCALLPTRPPVHKFTPLTIGAESPNGKFVTRHPALVGFASTGVVARVLTRMPTMAAPAAPAKDPLRQVAPVKAADKPPQDDEQGGKATDVPAGDGDEAINEEAAGGEPEGMPPAADPAMPPADPAAAPDPTMAPPMAPPAPAIDPITNLTNKVDQLLAIMTKLIEAPVATTPGEPVPTAGAPSTAFADPTVKALEVGLTDLAKRLDAREASDAKARDLAEARRALEPFRHGIPDVEGTIESLYAAGGKPALAKFSEVVRRTVRRDPTISTLDDGEIEPVVLPDSLAKFANRGPDELAEVSRLSREYDQRGPVFARTMTRERFVDLHLHLKQIGR